MTDPKAVTSCSVTKRCSRCTETKSSSEFYVVKNYGVPKLTSHCRICIGQARAKSFKEKCLANPLYKPNRVPVIAGSRCCGRCHKEVPVEDYSIHKNGKIHSYCKSCVTEYGRNRPKTPESIAKRKESSRVRLLKVKYDITPEQYAALSRKQKGLCAICNRTPGAHGLVIDHCHQTGLVRGLLCGLCNTALGHLREDPSIFKQAVSYLQVDGIL